MKTNLVIVVCFSLMGVAGSFAASKKPYGAKVPEKPLTPEQQFEKMDVNHDGELNHAEFLPHFKDIVEAKKKFKAMDTDKNGKVSREEFLAHHHKK